MRNGLQTLLGILFLAGFASGFLGVASLKYDLVINIAQLYAPTFLIILLGSCFTPLIIRYSTRTGVWGYLQDIFNHFLLNISIIGANGLFLFLFFNAYQVENCQKTDYTVIDWKNTVHKMKYSDDYEAWVLLRSAQNDTLLLQFDSHLPKAPQSIKICLAKGNFGLWLIRDREIMY